MTFVVKRSMLVLLASVIMLAVIGGKEAVAQQAGRTGKERRQRLYRSYLEEQGYRPEIDEDGDVKFMRDGLIYFIIIPEEDSEYFQLALPNIWTIDSEGERRRVERAAVATTAETKVAKVYPVRDKVWATLELFCIPPEAFKPVFARAMSALNVAAVKFVEKMQK